MISNIVGKGAFYYIHLVKVAFYPGVLLRMNESAKKNNRVCLTLEKKVEVIREQEKSGKSSRALASQFNCGKTQIDNILKRRREWLEAYELDPTNSLKRKARRTRNDEINALTWEWFMEATVPVTGTLLQEKALSFADRLGISTFKASNGWLESFRKRHSISFGRTSGCNSVSDNELGIDWKIELPKLCEGYALRDVYIACPMNLYFRASTEYTLYMEGRGSSEGENSDEQITVLVCANALGEKEKLVVIGESAKLHTLYDLELHTLPVHYHHSNRAQMTGVIFESWLKEFDKHVALENRKVLLFVKRNPSHPCLHLQNITLKFLSDSTTTSASQLMDEDVIQVTKFKFRVLQLRHIIRKLVIEKDKAGPELLKETSLLDTIYWIHQAWTDVDPKNIVRCFFKAGFKVAESFHGDMGREMDDDKEMLDQLCQDVLGISILDFADLDSVLETCEEELTLNGSAEDMLEAHHGRTGEANPQVHDIKEECLIDPICIMPHEAMECIQKLKYYFLQSGESSLFDSMMDIERKVDDSIFDKFKLARQASLLDN